MKAKQGHGPARLLSCAPRIGVISPCTLDQLSLWSFSTRWHSVCLAETHTHVFTITKHLDFCSFLSSHAALRRWSQVPLTAADGLWAGRNNVEGAWRNDVERACWNDVELGVICWRRPCTTFTNGNAAPMDSDLRQLY